MITTSQILTNLRIEQLTPMQEAVLDMFSIEKNVVLLAPTGSGKTLAYLLPLLLSLSETTEGVQALVLVPSRELALQTENIIKQANTPFRSMSCYGGRPAMDEHRSMKGIRPAVIVGTPGRINDHLQKGNIDASTIQTLVIDEFDKCLEFGFQDEMKTVIGQLPGLKKRVLLSATEAEEIPVFTGVDNRDILKLDYRDNGISDRLNLQLVHSPEKDKLETVFKLLCALGDQHTLLFVNYRESVERVTGFLQAHKFPCDMFHGGMEQDDRERSLYKFRNGSCPVLVSTDLAARGLDIPIVDNIVHYHLPINEEAFTHRNGRTARWKATGSSYLILHEEETIPPYLSQDIPVFNLPEENLPVPKPIWATVYIGRGKKEKLSKTDIVGFLYKKGGLARDDVGQVDVKDHFSFAAVKRNKLRQMLSLVWNEKIKGSKTIIEEAK